MFFFRFISWLSPTRTKQNTHTHRHTHTRRRPRCFFYFSLLYFHSFFFFFGCCDFCCTNFVISLTFTCQTTTQLAQIESIETLCLHFHRSKLHSICCHQERQAALAAYDNRQHDAKEGSVNHKGCARVCIQEHV